MFDGLILGLLGERLCGFEEVFIIFIGVELELCLGVLFLEAPLLMLDHG